MVAERSWSWVAVHTWGWGVVTRWQQVLTDHVFIRKSLAETPTFWCLVKCEPELEAGVHVGQSLQLITQQDVILRLVGKDEWELQMILGVFKHLSDQLQYWCDTSSTNNHADFLDASDHAWRLFLVSCDLMVKLPQLSYTRCPLVPRESM